MGDMYMQTKSRNQTARRILLFWTLFIGVGAAAGAAGMLLDPSGKAMGMDAMLPYFQVLPFADVLFRDLTFSGWALLIVNGLTNLTAASLLLAKKNAGITLGGLFGVTLMLWIRIQFYMFPPNFMSTIYFMFGFAQADRPGAAFCDYNKKNSSTSTTAQQPTATWNRFAPNHAAAIPNTSAARPAMGEFVAWTMDGKVITASVTYGT